VIGSIDGTICLRGQDEALPSHAESLGTRLAEKLLGEGAGELLSS